MLPKTIVSKDGREIIIRHVAERDAEPLIRLLNAVFAEEAFMLRTVFTQTADEEREFIRTLRPPNLFIVAERQGTLVGWLTLFQHRAEYCRHVAELGMGVKKGLRSVGIGSALMRTALEWAAEAGFEKVTLGVRASNVVAKGFYEAFGFVHEGRRVRQVKHRGEYDDDHQMAYFVPADSSATARRTSEDTGDERIKD